MCEECAEKTVNFIKLMGNDGEFEGLSPAETQLAKSYIGMVFRRDLCCPAQQKGEQR